MADYTHVDLLGIHAWGRRVGVLTASERARGAYVFQYDPDWLTTSIELAPLLMARGAGTGRGRDTFLFPTDQYNDITFKGLPPMLADSLPDAFGNTLIDAALREGGIDGEATALDRLAYMGSRTMGALTFEPAGDPPADPATAIDLRELVETARATVSGDLSTEDGTSAALKHLLQVGTSAGGARPKAVVAFNPDTVELRAGNIDLDVPGFQQWLLKFDGVGKRTSTSTGQRLGDPRGYTRIEQAYYLMARAAGLNVPETALLEEGGRAHFMIRRFDRTDTDERLHQQSLCGLTGLDFNLQPDEAGRGNRYEDYFATLTRMGVDSDADRREAFRRLVFNVLASNNDDHTKNFAFLMDSTGAWSLAPAYDLTYSYSPESLWVSSHLMSVGGKRAGITRRDLMDFADRQDVPGAASIIDQVEDAVAHWDVQAAEAGVSAANVAMVGDRLDAVTAEARA
ncbi:type II toxin-antitoxin system HipA family toxin [Demequina capsici]|uniref:Type II toxin-antitoxin system HipA family toxin n=1 Tax=Demequina capsici TaxID=3075620 RepID=A0AA96FBS3_9MICO|nr:type II toxin-antitoxin system HipA family toxin [Demequina sp. PMTSA13]WNM27354.1 type II toxin-antitoxin system HipA family toxin [Demequina sp. PMTSA13]